MIVHKSPFNNQIFGSNFTYLSSPKADFHEKITFYSILEKFDKQIDSYSQRTKGILSNYNKKLDSSNDYIEGSLDLQSRIQILEKKYADAEARTNEVLNLVRQIHESNNETNEKKNLN